MRHPKRSFLFCILFFLASYSLSFECAHAARVAGDNKVTPSTPASESAPATQPQENGINAGDEIATPAPGTIINPVDPNGQNDNPVAEENRPTTPPVVSPSPGGTRTTTTGKNNAVKNPTGRNTGVAAPGMSAGATGTAPVATGQSSTANASKVAGGYVTIDFDNVDITLFIKFISELTGKNFIIDNNVKGKVTVMSPAKITVEEAYKVFESVLEINGFTTVTAGSVTKIVPMVEARAKDIETRFGSESSNPEDRLVTQLIPLKFASPDEMKTVLAPFISKNSIMISYAATNTLIITDVLSNIKRIQGIIEKIDVEGTGEIISVIPLQYAGAETMSKSLTSIFKTSAPKSAKDTSSSIVIVSDARTNSILTLASEVDTLKIKDLIKLLDKETPRGEGSFHIYYLQNANAEDLAKVLTSIPTTSKSVSTTTSTGATTAATATNTPIVLSNNIQILADKATNSLIVNAGKDDYLVLEDIIKKLDITRKMVYIEALIMEISMSKEFNLGVQWYGAKKTGSVNGTDIYSFASSSTGTSLIDSSGDLSLPSGMSLGILGDTITVGSLTFPSIQAFIQAYNSNSAVHILSTPQVTALNNEEATIKVTDKVPTLKSKETTSTTSNDYSNYEYQDVGVTLVITPQINQDRFVKLKIDQTVSQVKSQTVVGLPTILSREAKTTIMIKDAQTIVIGGLIEETNDNTNYKVPILGSIPLVGYLFRSKTESMDKKNLYIFITPHIIENTSEVKDLYENKMGEMNKVQEGSVIMNGGSISKTKDERLSDKGYEYLREQDYDEASEYYQKALKKNPNNPFALLNLGIIYERNKDKNKAIEMYEKVISLDSDDITYTATDPTQNGRKLKDIAKEKLQNLKGVEVNR
jgi:general secretion pathway protein D